MLQYPKKITVCEVSTRDGFQSLPFEVETEDKIELLDKIARAGIREIEVGSFVPGRTGSLWQMSRTPEVFDRMARRDGVVYRSLLQTPEGARQAVEHGCSKFKINISGSEKHYHLMTGKAIADGVAGFKEIGEVAAKHGVKLLGSISLAFMSPYDGKVPEDRLKMIIQGFLDAGAEEISLNDTAGMATPTMVYEYFTAMQAAFPEVETWAFHPHNTRGMGLANTVAALEAGIAKVDSSLAGIGGCSVFKNASGNISTEDLVYMLDGMGIQTGIDMEKLIEAGCMVEDLVKHKGCDSYIQRIEKFKRAGEDVE